MNEKIFGRLSDEGRSNVNDALQNESMRYIDIFKACHRRYKAMKLK